MRRRLTSWVTHRDILKALDGIVRSHAVNEAIRGLQTSNATFDMVARFAKRVGKTPIDVKSSPGFAVNRILVPMINEAIFALHEGLASAEQIDAGMELGANHPVGPLALVDLI